MLAGVQEAVILAGRQNDHSQGATSPWCKRHRSRAKNKHQGECQNGSDGSLGIPMDNLNSLRSVSPQRWQELRLEMEASAHEALGHVATKRGKLQEAILEFERAVQQNPVPQGSQFYRLGVAYMLAQK